MKKKLDILYEDKYIIVVNKKSKLLTIASNKEKEKTLYREVSSYVKKQDKNNRIFIVHRLDRETSGLIIFAKNIKVKTKLQNNWSKVERKYIALVHGKMPKEKDKLIFLLKENNFLKVEKTNNPKVKKEAISIYEVIKENAKYSLLDIKIETGRKHQIRVSLALINHPIVGDRKYGIKDNSNNFCLCANYLKFNHPITNKVVEIKLPIPKYFNI